MTSPQDNGANDETRFLGQPARPEAPRQYFPPQQQPGYQDQDFGGQQYDRQPQYAPPPEDQYYGGDYEPEPRRRGGTGGWILGVLLVLALAALIIVFFLWRNAASEADREPVPPETSTVEQTTTVTESVTPAPSAEPSPEPTGDTGLPLPTGLPEELNPENINPEDFLPEGYTLDDLEQFLN
ncbi:hypothetical protein [Corynebacterium halotolerans]|uniref:hypothetical protein n=1 Tax=Corynebacterium halotolerans TaxID=225326 RepID=UPI003CE974B4